ncbi:hypothetical protein Pan161_29100 [Gimesia algae]|uniref:Secretin/TonB short N-terminal domain-containing protein n=2 Tax=Gimesia algae TaxID=2527971 RepID=A0A517VE24_9PLAN|nr:hypothetical protein Pan161_29100 [Gimesia algae]
MRWFMKRSHLFVLLLCISAGWVLMTVSAEVEQNTRAANPETSCELDHNIVGQDVLVSSQKHQPLQLAQKQTTASEIQIIQPFYPPLTRSEETIQKELNTKTKADFPHVPLSEVMDFFQNQHGINIYLDALALKQDGLTVEEPVNVSLSGISLKSAFDIILRPIGLDYVIDQEVLKITTIEEANRILKVRIYPVADLGNSPEEFQALENVIRNTCLPSSATRQKTYPVDDLVIGGSRKSTRKSKVQYSSRSISVVPQCQALVVNETDRVHFKITELLSQLRQVSKAQKGQSSEVE